MSIQRISILRLNLKTKVKRKLQIPTLGLSLI